MPTAQTWHLQISICLDPSTTLLRGRRFAADEVKEAVHDWLRSKPQTFFSNGIKKLTDCWAKCIKKKGDYIEK